LHGHVDLAATNAMTDRSCRGLRTLEMASGHDHFVIGPQIRRDTLSDDAVATCYQNALLSHGVSPSVQWRSEWSLRAAGFSRVMRHLPRSEERRVRNECRSR